MAENNLVEFAFFQRARDLETMKEELSDADELYDPEQGYYINRCHMDYIGMGHSLKRARLLFGFHYKIPKIKIDRYELFYRLRQVLINRIYEIENENI
jgi:hypothetical protein